MTPEAMREIGRRLYQEAIERRREEILDELVAEDCVDSSPDIAPGVRRQGREPMRHFIRSLHSGLDDVHVRIHELLVDGDSLVARVTFEGAHQGSMLGAPPTGRWIAWDAIEVFHVREGQIRERIGIADRLGLLMQLGLVEAPETQEAPEVRVEE
jgi:predicted ester cyclase